jgi:APA family basic amino acid/polyamine antiporter
MNKFFRTKAVTIPAEDSALKRTFTATDLTLLGIGGIIGAGIFVITGIAATVAGPAVIISYIVAAIACAFAALSYAELAASVGGSGSAYSYAYAGFGELIAWIIGWDLILEYGISIAVVAIGWSGYFNNALDAIGLQLPHYLLHNIFDGGFIDLSAVGVVLSIALLLSLGVTVGKYANNFAVGLKLIAIIIFIAVAVFNVDFNNWNTFMPFGWSGVMHGAALIFFAYIGFDAVSTAAEETINPQRDLPKGIINSLIICTILYILVAGLLTAIVPYSSLNVSSPISFALLKIGYNFAGGLTAMGAIAGLFTVMLVMYYGLSRIFFAMARDGLLPALFSRLHPRTKTPVVVIGCSALLIAPVAGFMPMNDVMRRRDCFTA